MSYTHPRYGIVTPDNQTKAKDLGAELKQMGATIEATLKSFDYNGADPNLVLARVAALETKFTPSTPANPLTAAAGWKITEIQFERTGIFRSLFVIFERTGGPITVSATGDITNETIGSIAQSQDFPLVRVGLSSGHAGRTTSGTIHPATGAVDLAAMSPGGNLATGATLSFGATWIAR